MINVLVVTVVHHPLDARILHRQIRSLVGEGMAVTYAAPFAATKTAPSQLPIHVRPIDLPRASGRDRIGALRAARTLLRQSAAAHDLVLLHDPELLFAVVGQRSRMPPVVLDVHEDLASSVSDRPWVPRAFRPIARGGAWLLERYAERHLHLLLAEDGYLGRFRRRHPVVRNLPWLPGAPGPRDDPPRVVYVGRLSVARGALDLLSAARELRSYGEVLVDIVGPADPDIEPFLLDADASGLVRWHGFLPNDRALEVVRGSAVGLSLLHDHPNYTVSRPTKLIEYLAYGVPVVSTPLPEAISLVERNTVGPCGIIVPYRQPSTVASVVVELLDDQRTWEQMAGNARTLVEQRYSWEVEAQRFCAILACWAEQGEHHP